METHEVPSRDRGSRSRAFLSFAAGIALVLVSAMAVGCDGSRGRDHGRPNLVVIVTDDQRWDTLAAMPSVQRLLVDGGITFSNAFATTPSCCPSRASLLTGQYSHTTGVLDGSTGNAPGGAPAFRDTSTLATWLDEAGYRTGLVGKYLNDYLDLPEGYVPPGWDEWFAVSESRPQIRYYDYRINDDGRIVRFGGDASDYSTTILRDEAVRFVARGTPFFLYFAPLAVHLPALPAPEDANVAIPGWSRRPPSFDEQDVSDKPMAPRTRLDRAKAREVRTAMIRSLIGVDRAIQAIADAVADAGASEDTYFILTADNGYLWGEHRLTGKVWPYEESIRVPLVIRQPGHHPTRTVDQMALNIDIAPTIADLAGIAPGLPQDGRSLVPLIRDRPVSWRGGFVVEFLGFAPGTPPYVGLRTTRHLYVEYRNGWRELYNVEDDPFQLRNLLHGRRSPRIQDLLDELRGALHAETAWAGP